MDTKKPHWTQTPEGKLRMKQILKARKAAKKVSRAEVALKRAGATPSNERRIDLYRRTIKMAVDNNEVPMLMTEVGSALMFAMIGGKR